MTRGILFITALGVIGCLSGCIFGKDDDTFSYTTSLSQTTQTVYAYNADGSIRENLGVGLEVVAENGLSDDGKYVSFDSNGNLLALWPDNPSYVFFARSVSHEKVLSFAGFSRNSTYTLDLYHGILLPQILVRDARVGFPCAFSEASAFQIASNGDTIPLTVSGTHLDHADTVRFAVLLDEAALAATARFDSLEPVTGRVKVTCPEP